MKQNKVEQIFHRLSRMEKTLLADPSQRYNFDSQTQKPFEVVSSGDFTVQVKMGMFIEIFYSPYQDEVLQISLIKKINALKPGIEHAKYYSQK